MKRIIQIFLLSLCYFLASCISVSMPESKVVRASNVEFSAPSSIFIKSEHADLDNLWSNPTNGNSISFLSDCQTNNDPTLDTITLGIVKDLDRKKVLQSQLFSYNQREGLHSKYSGSVDGIPTVVELIVFKKNSCIYVLTYVALRDSYPDDIHEFIQFYQGFKAP